MSYVDGFVIPIKKSNLEAYKTMAEEGKALWMKHGALQYFECVGDDLNPDHGEMAEMGEGISFPTLTKLADDETVIFAFIIYRDRGHRDEVNAKVFEEMGEKYKDQKDFTMPFDLNRHTTGGFTTIVQG